MQPIVEFCLSVRFWVEKKVAEEEADEIRRKDDDSITKSRQFRCSTAIRELEYYLMGHCFTFIHIS